MKREKGITLITLTVAVAIMIIISSMLIYNAKNGIKIRNLKMMQNDIEILDDKINAYYVKYGALPIEIKYIGTFPENFEAGANDGEEYYVIDLKALEGITLNYGLDFNNIKSEEDTKTYSDVYIINKDSHKIYYPHGIVLDGVTYYTTTADEDIPLYNENIETGEIAIEFLPNGNLRYAKEQSCTVKVSKDGKDVEITSLKYVWVKKGEVANFSSATTMSNNSTVTGKAITGEYYLYAQATDKEGKVIESKSNTFRFDNVNPVITAGTATATSATSFRLNITANDSESGLNKYFVTTSTTAPTIEASGWKESTETNYIYNGAATNTTYYVYVQDGVGNISNAQKIVTTPLNYSIDDNAWTETLEQAVNVAKTSGSTIKLLNDYTDLSTVSISKSLTYNTNGRTLTRTKAINIERAGQVVVTGNGVIQSNDSIEILQNSGTLEFNTNFIGTIKSNFNIPEAEKFSIFPDCISNKTTGTLNIKNGNFLSIGNRVIVNEGTSSITGGEFTLNESGTSTGTCIMNVRDLTITSSIINSNAHGTVVEGKQAFSYIIECKINNYSTNLPSLYIRGDGGEMLVYETTVMTAGEQKVAWISEGGGYLYLFDCKTTGNFVEMGAGCLAEVVTNDVGCTVYYYSSDANRIVEFPTWTNNNDQDDIIWYRATSYGTRNNWGCYSQTIKKSEHNNETGNYITHIYEDGVFVGGFGYEIN